MLQSKDEMVDKIEASRKDLTETFVIGQEALRNQVESSHSEQLANHQKVVAMIEASNNAREEAEQAREASETRNRMLQEQLLKVEKIKVAELKELNIRSAQKLDKLEQEVSLVRREMTLPTRLEFVTGTSSTTCVSQEETRDFTDDDVSSTHATGSSLSTGLAGPLHLRRQSSKPPATPARDLTRREASSRPPRTPARPPAVKTQDHGGVDPRETPLTDRMSESEKRHIDERREGRRRSRHVRRCQGESGANASGKQARIARAVSRVRTSISLGLLVVIRFRTSTGEVLSPTTTGELRRSTRSRTRGQTKPRYAA